MKPLVSRKRDYFVGACEVMSAPSSVSFRKYVESTGVSDLLGKALAQLFERHENKKDPENAVEFVRSLIASESTAVADTKLAEENAALKKEVQKLSESLAKLIEEREKRQASDAAASKAEAEERQAREEENARAKREAEEEAAHKHAAEEAAAEKQRQEASAKQRHAAEEAERHRAAQRLQQEEAEEAAARAAQEQEQPAEDESQVKFGGFATFEDSAQ